MIRRSPCETYIKYLLVHPDENTNADVMRRLRKLALDFPSERYISELRQDLETPTPFRPFDLRHHASHRFLLRHRLVSLFHPDDSSRHAERVLKAPRAKEIVESMALTQEPDALIAAQVRSIGVNCNIGGVKRYKDIYWDLSLVDNTELRALLSMRSERILDENPGPDEVLQHKAMRRAMYKDTRALALEIPITPLAAVMGRMLQGHSPGKLDLARIAAASLTAASVRTYNALVVGGHGAATEARDYSIAARNMQDLLTELGSPDALLQKELQQLALKSTEGRPPMLSDLSGGRHTLDVQPMPVQTTTDVQDSEVILEPAQGYYEHEREEDDDGED